ncbi:MAG: hotdog domain-containing protein [FCB group bacterium]|jgi:acyl-CoA thioesterase YciA|nr:hotdog domain-containing protein [FCB group bacterium]
MTAFIPRGNLALRVVPMPADVNGSGDVFGGWLLDRVDTAAAIAAAQRAKGRVATVAVNSVQFKLPVAMGDVLSLYTNILSTGRTSITVSVEVYAERNATQVKVTEATVTLVAIDSEGCKRPLP